MATETYSEDCDNTAKRDSQIEAQCMKVERALEALSSQIGLLDGRLKSILRQPNPEAKSDECERQALVPHAEKLNGFVRKIEVETSRIQDILGRLEV